MSLEDIIFRRCVRLMISDKKKGQGESLKEGRVGAATLELKLAIIDGSKLKLPRKGG
jgi:hypothetical protein